MSESKHKIVLVSPQRRNHSSPQFKVVNKYIRQLLCNQDAIARRQNLYQFYRTFCLSRSRHSFVRVSFPAPNAERTWREEARFAAPSELAMCLRWGLARGLRVSGGNAVRGFISGTCTSNGAKPKSSWTILRPISKPSSHHYSSLFSLQAVSSGVAPSPSPLTVSTHCLVVGLKFVFI
ncbi:hypothetical protein BC826DRAFT_357491 [Russula brevipes]|nr:hypothetical protein BC826DRAFT_357491 [Russula brevipes]